MPINASAEEVVTTPAKDEVTISAVPERDYNQYKIMNLMVDTNLQTLVSRISVRLWKMYVDSDGNEFLAPRDLGDVIKLIEVPDVYVAGAI